MSQKRTILYIDDEAVNLFLFRRMFEDRYEVVTASSPNEALAKLESIPSISAVFSDMKMPGMDGISFVKRAKKQFDHIAYYIITAFSFNTDIDRAIADKLIKRVFPKPFDVPTIHEELDGIPTF